MLNLKRLLTLSALASAAMLAPITQAHAQLAGPVCMDGLALPRFVSLQQDEVWMRSGPGIEHPRTHVFPSRRVPLEIINQQGEWRQVRDPEGDTGWLHETDISGSHLVIIRGGTASLVEDPLRSNIVVRTQSGVVGDLHSCEGRHCRITVIDSVGKRFTGWVERRAVWGVHDWWPDQDPCLNVTPTR
ncbi:MAG: SH3 domain-containing protein [Alphaproteobacteria bacterium]